MPDITLLNSSGAATGTVSLDDDIFAAAIRADLVHAAVVAQLAAKRTGTHQAKSRGQVRGGGRKPYRQKGTGRARQGSTRAPQWKGGGVVFPPMPRDYSQRLPRKVKRAALFAAWSEHVADGSLLAVDTLALATVKTKVAAETLRTLLTPAADQVAAVTPAPGPRPEGDERAVRRVKTRRHVLVLLAPDEAEVKRAFANLDTIRFDYEDKVSVVFAVKMATAPYASVYDLTLADVVIASQSSLARITAEFAGVGEVEEVEA